jgi:acyl-CoA thioester hydrolase
MSVEPAWIDYNGHMNMAYYNVLFDRGGDFAFDQIGIGTEYIRLRGLSFFVAEIHVCYVRELHDGDEVTVSFRIVDADAKRIHAYLEICHTDGWLAATSEILFLHVDLSSRKVLPTPPDISARIEAVVAAHAALPQPERIGRSIGIRRK